MKRRVTCFALEKDTVDDLDAWELIDLLRYEGARPLGNAPDGWYVFEKATDTPVTWDRLQAHGVRIRTRYERRGLEPTTGSCPDLLRWDIDSDALDRAMQVKLRAP